MIKNTCCFVGHNPTTLPWGYDENGTEYNIFSRNLDIILNHLIDQNVYSFITGMDMGFDIIAAEKIINLKNIYPNIQLICAVPFINDFNDWTYSYINRYNEVLRKANKIAHITNQPYTQDCIQKRNQYMINNSSHLIALHNGTKGNTYSAIQLAKQNNLNIKIINC